MTRLGPRPYRASLGGANAPSGICRYVAQGGDIGAGITDAMAIQAPDGLAAFT